VEQGKDPTDADIELRGALVERPRQSGVMNVIGITGPDLDSRFALFLQSGGDNTEARAVLAATPGIADVRRSRQTGSMVTFKCDRRSAS
jgi:hypothetical protein